MRNIRKCELFCSTDDCQNSQRDKAHTSPYRLRKQLPEPVFGQIKQARGFRQFLLRGLANVRAEWAIMCAVHNLLKLAHSRTPSCASPMSAAAA